MAVKKRFIAGVRCNHCNALDRVVMYSTDDDEWIECIDCGKTRQAVLAVGGSVDALTAFKNFRGREPELTALLRHNGWAADTAASTSTTI